MSGTVSPAPVIPHCRLTLGAAESAAVAAVVASGRLAQGELVAAFEERLATFLGLGGGVAVSSGTAALHLALVALGVGPGDQVIVPDYCCVAPVNAVRHAGAEPVTADVDPFSGQLDVAAVRNLLTPRVKAVIVVHLGGAPAPAAAIRDLGVPVIEDLAQALGARQDGRPLGTFGDLAVTSFYATKVITTGEGGMVLADDPRLLARVRDLRDYDEKEDYRPRFNYKMTEIQAALGMAQLDRLPAMLEARRAAAAFYDRELAGLGLGLPVRVSGGDPMFYRYVVRLEQDVQGFIAAMARQGVTCRRPVFRPLSRLLGTQPRPASQRLWQRAVSLPIYPSLERDEQARVVAAVRRVCHGEVRP